MGQNDILQWPRAKPFLPFRIEVSNNKVYEINHPDLAVVSPTSLHIGVPGSGSTNDAPMEVVIVSMRHVVEVKPTAQPAGPGDNGSPT